MPRAGYRSVTISEDHAKKAEMLQKPLKKSSVAGVVEGLIDEKQAEVENHGSASAADGSAEE